MALVQYLFIFICLAGVQKGEAPESFFVKAPDTLEAFSGSCVLIPCEFNLPKYKLAELMTPAHGIWKKDFIELTQGMVFNSSETNNKLAGKIVGDLIEKNCTTVFDKITEKYTGKYFFRLETSKGIKHSFPESVEINVKASPPKPQLSMQTRVMEGEWVNGTCVVEAPCPQQPPTLTWGPLGGSTVELRRNTDGTHRAFSYLRFQASHRQHHGRSVSCSAAFSQGGNISSANTTTDRLAVLYPPRNLFVSVTPSGLVAEGTNVTLTCSSDAYPPVEDQGYRWFRDKDPVLVSSPILVLNWSSNDTGLYYCEAKNPFGAQISSAVKINVNSTDNVKSMSNSMSLGLSCFGVLSVVGLVILVSLLWRRCQRTKASSQSDRMTTQNGGGAPDGSGTRCQPREEPVYNNYPMTMTNPVCTVNGKTHMQDGIYNNDNVYANI